MKINLVGAKGGVGTSVLTVTLAMHFEGVALSASSHILADHRAIAAMPPPERDEVLTRFGEQSHRFDDCGTTPPAKLGGWSTVLVTDNSYQALRALVGQRHTFDAMIVTMRPSRALLLADVLAVTEPAGITLLGAVTDTVEMARCVDAGLLRTRLPKLFARELDVIATALTHLDAGVTP